LLTIIGIRENEAHRAALKRQRSTTANLADPPKNQQARKPPEAKRNLTNYTQIGLRPISTLSAISSEKTWM